MRPSLFPTAFFDSIPESTGVYFFLDEKGTILYIGKAKNLRNRILGHRRSGAEMLPHIHTVRWEIHRTEQAALDRENELLHTVRPEFNIADTQSQHHLFIGWKLAESPTKGLLKAEFVLSSEEIDFTPDHLVYGCFKRRFKTKEAYMALLRLLWAVQFTGRSFSYPARFTRGYPLWHADLEIRARDAELLKIFFEGRRIDFLRQLSIDLIGNDRIPAFMVYSIQEDLDRLREFFRYGPWTTRKLKRANAYTGHIVSQQLMDQWVAGTIDWEDEPQPSEFAPSVETSVPAAAPVSALAPASAPAPVMPGLTRKPRKKSEPPAAAS